MHQRTDGTDHRPLHAGAAQRHADGPGRAPASALHDSARLIAQRRQIAELFGPAAARHADQPVQRIHVHMSGSGVEAGEESLGEKFGAAYESNTPDGSKRASHTVSGPGRGPESEHPAEKRFGEGTTQSYQGQDARILNAVRRIGVAWLEGDREIMLTGFSRGGANAIEVARFINLYGLLDSRNELIEGTAGAKIKYLGLLDPVPVESLPMRETVGGTARKLTGVQPAPSHPLEESIDPQTRLTKTTPPDPRRIEVQSESVWYEDLGVPANVQFVKSILAHAENRASFDAYRVQAENPDATHVESDVIPFAVHSQVGGTFYGGTESPAALLAFDALLSGAKDAGVDFGELPSLSARERRDYVARTFKEPRAAEDSTTTLMIRMRPKMRSFKSRELGPVAEEFLEQLASQPNVESLAPVFQQFHLPPPYVTEPLAIPPYEYFGAITGPQAGESGARLPRSGGALAAGALMPQLLLLIVLVYLLVKFFRWMRK